jgi:hypothetical protein
MGVIHPQDTANPVIPCYNFFINKKRKRKKKDKMKFDKKLEEMIKETIIPARLYEK